MTIIGSASIQIRADDKYFEPDVRRAVAKIKNLGIKLRVDADTSAASKKIRDLRYRLTQKDAEIKIRANDAKFEDDVRKAVNKIRNVQIELKADVDVAKASKKIRDLRYRITSNVAVLKIDADTKRAEEKMRKFLEKFTENKKLEFTAVAHTGEANTALEELKRKYAANRVPFTATANTAAANAALAFTARRRRAQIFAHVDPRAMAAVKGMFNALTGTVPFEKIKNVLFGIMANFESIVTKGTLAVAVVSALSASVITLGANIFSIAGDITQVIGISAMLPAAFIALGSIIAANKMAWKGFGEALSSDPEKAAAAIAKLEPAAQSAALAMRGTGTEIRKATQVSFWSNMNGVIEYAVDRLLPELVSGFGAVGSSMGQLQNTGITALADTFGGGVLEGILGNIAGFLSNASTGVAKFISAFGTLATVGSTYLPDLGQSLTNAATRFDNFIKKADEAGKINQWIETATRRFQELGDISGATIAIMGTITDIARLTGAPGLTDMANGFIRIANAINSEPYTSRLIAIFTGAREGTDKLGEGLSTLTGLFGRSSESIGSFLSLAGEIAGLSFSNITAMFDGTGLGSGLYTALMGLRDALEILTPGFANIGTAIGELGRVAGSLLTSMAPGLNMLADTISGVVLALGDGFIAAMVPLNQFIQALLGLASGPIVAIATGIGNLLELFGDMPSSIQIVIAVFGAFILLRGRFEAFFLSIQVGAMKAWTSMSTSASTNTSRVQALLAAQASAAEGSSARQIAAAQRASATIAALAARTAAAQAGSAAGAAAAQAASAATGAAAQTAAAGTAAAGVGAAAGSMADHGSRIAGAWRGVGSTFQNAGGGLHGLAGGATAAMGAIGTTASSGLQMAGKGLMTMLGGPWGIALMAAGTALTVFAGNTQKAKADLEAMTQTLDKQTGAFTNATKEQMGKDILDFDRGNFDKVIDWLEGASESSSDILEKMGADLDEITEKLSSTEGAQKYLDSWKEINETLNHGGKVTQEMADKVNLSADALNSMNSQEVTKVGDEIEKTGENAIKAQQQFKDLADKMGTSTIEAQRLTANYATLASTTSSVSDKLSALKSNLDILSGGKRSAMDAEKDYHEAVSRTGESLKEISEREGVRMNALVDTAGAFDMTSQAGRDLYTTLSDSADSILQTSVSAFDAARQNGKTIEEAQTIAMVAMDKPLQAFRDSLKSFGFADAQINGIIESLNLIPGEVNTALYADGNQATMEAARTQIAMAAFAAGNYTAVLAALPQAAKDAIGEAYGVAEEFAAGDFEAVLTAMDKTPGGKDAALASLATFDGTDWTAFLKANNMIPEEVAKANEAASKMFKEKNIDLVANDMVTAVLEEANAYDIQGKKVDLTAEDNVSALLNQINSSNLVDKNNQLTTEDLVTQAIDNLNRKQLGGKLTRLQADDLATVVMDELNAKTVDGKEATITAKDLASTVLTHISEFEIDPKAVEAIDNTEPAVTSAKGQLGSVPPAVTTDINANNLAGAPTWAATALMNSVPSVTKDINALNLVGGPVGGAISGMNSVPSVTKNINALNLVGGPVGGAVSQMNSVPSVTKDINANDFASKVAGLAGAAIRLVSGKDVDIRANDYASGPAGNARSAIDAIKSKTVDIVTNFFRRDHNADGGFYSGDGVRQFANGGILDGAHGAAVKSFAGGGIENHTAQIARGAWPVRIWAEPETGGEAYIPLAKSKRKRSLDILKIVMGEFGLGHLTQSFAQGGIMPPSKVSSVVSARYAASSGGSDFAGRAQSNRAPIVVQVNPSAAMDEEQIGQAAARELYWRMMYTEK